MSRAYKVLRVFVASPSDVAEERERLRAVIDELNTTWSGFLSLHLELIRWETHGFPGMGDDAQDVLNQEFADDYDIFVGIMWKKFGTPTGRAGSGTEEEFNRAHARWQQDRGAVDIMFYFRRVPEDELKADAKARRVRRFRKKLGELGGLWWEFADPDEFVALLRIHLARQVQKRVESTAIRNSRRVAESRPDYAGRGPGMVKPEQGALLAMHDAAYQKGLKDIVFVLRDMGTKMGGLLRDMQAKTGAGKTLADTLDAISVIVNDALPRFAAGFTSMLNPLSLAMPLLILEAPELAARRAKLLIDITPYLDEMITFTVEVEAIIKQVPNDSDATIRSAQAAQLAAQVYRREIQHARSLIDEVVSAFGGVAEDRRGANSD